MPHFEAGASSAGDRGRRSGLRALSTIRAAQRPINQTVVSINQSGGITSSYASPIAFERRCGREARCDAPSGFYDAVALETINGVAGGHVTVGMVLLFGTCLSPGYQPGL
jgi:hypothetical protein